MKTKLQKSIEYIKGYCEKHDSCDFCKLHDKETKMMCMCKDLIPVDWKYKVESEVEDGSTD